MEHNRVVYTRPYDAEVEYLESSENQFIDTGIIISSNIGILADIQMTTNNAGWFFGGGEGYLINEFGIMADVNYSIFRFGNKEVRLTPLLNTEKITFDNLENPNVLKVGNLIYTTTYNTFTSAATMYLFANNRINTAKRSTVGERIFYFKIYYSGILVRDFIPVRVGSTGYMYDKVSGKLFGNKGTGKFTLGSDIANPVPNIRRVVYIPKYDAEVEYLQSSGTQWIDTGIIHNLSDTIETRIQFTKSSNTRQRAFGAWESGKSCMIQYDESRIDFTIGDTIIAHIQGDTDVHDYLYDGITRKGYIDNVTDNNIANKTSNNTSLGIFYQNRDGIIYDFSFARIYYFRIKRNGNYILNLIPVRVGSVGYMYDKVSGQLFGNSGTGNFVLGQDVAKPIVKRYVMPCGLEEGVDYQRYDWLKGDGTAYINTYIVVNVPSLYINTSFTKITNVKNTPLFGARNIVGFHGSHIFYMSDESLRFDIMSDKNPCITTTEIQNINQLIIDCPNKVLNFNGTIFASRVNNLSIKNSTNTFKIFSMEVLNTKGSTMNAPYNGAFGDFILNDFAHSIHLTPCQLLRSIPTYLDANGKARQVGECGMIDLISGKFYGNIANTGTFTVENDN